MNANASQPWAQNPAGVPRTFLVALLAAAFLLGGTGGYLVRGLSSAAGITTHTETTTHPFVIEAAPYSSPLPSPKPQPTLDPNGVAVPI